MTRFFGVVLVLVAVVAAGFYFALRGVSDSDSTRTVEDTRVVLDGTPTTCGELFGAPCSLSLQTTYNRIAPRLDEFVRGTDLGPWAATIGFDESAALLVEACSLIGHPGQTQLEFVDLGRVWHPEAGSPELFPFWNRAREGLCPPSS
ncbi:hypothetical protein ACIBED_00620 [Rhodococcus coprophilus]|uniref:hypothetical protein n=1 Tax=Rhodococcus coprophilus TaxID=38310 RepID=UPI0037A52315